MNINASTSFTVEQQSGNRNKTQPKSDKASSSRSFSFVQKKKCFSRKKADLVLDIGGMYNGFEESIFQAVKNSEQEVEKR